MDWVHAMVNRVHGRGLLVYSALDHSEPLNPRWMARILWIDGVRDNLGYTIHLQASGRGWPMVLSGTRGDLSELSLALALVVHFPRGLHLHDLRRMGILTEVLAAIGEVGHGQAVRKLTQGKSVWSWGPWAAPPALIHLPVAAVASPLHLRTDGRGQGTVKWRGIEGARVWAHRGAEKGWMVVGAHKMSISCANMSSKYMK
jgi:hypothetical protein